MSSSLQFPRIIPSAASATSPFNTFPLYFGNKEKKPDEVEKISTFERNQAEILSKIHKNR